MKRWVGVVTLAVVLVTACSSIFAGSAGAAGTDVVWKTVPLPWASYGAGTVAAGDSTKWQHIGDENDSTRTAFHNTSDWAWDAFTGLGDAAVVNVAYLTCACLANNRVEANDSLYIAIEKRAPNGAASYNATITAAIGTVLTLQGRMGPSKSVYRGQLQYTADILQTLNIIGPGDDFRLVLKGDVDAASPAQGKCTMYLTYPSRRASSK